MNGQNPYFSRIMDAVDLWAGDVQRKKQLAEAERLETKRYERGQQAKNLQNKFSLLNTIAGGKDFDPESRKQATALSMQLLQNPETDISGMTPTMRTEKTIAVPDEWRNFFGVLLPEQISEDQYIKLAPQMARIGLSAKKQNAADEWADTKWEYEKGLKERKFSLDKRNIESLIKSRGQGGGGANKTNTLLSQLKKYQDEAVGLLKTGYGYGSEGMAKSQVDLDSVSSYLDEVGDLISKIQTGKATEEDFKRAAAVRSFVVRHAQGKKKDAEFDELNSNLRSVLEEIRARQAKIGKVQ